MSKLMSSLVAATMIGAFSLSTFAADAPKAPSTAATAEKPVEAPKKAKKEQHAKKAEEKKMESHGEPAKK